MESTQAFKHLRTLIKAASETDDAGLIHMQLTMMTVIIDKAAPKPKAYTPLWLSGPTPGEEASRDSTAAV
jgi:hypothetical protein